MKKIFSIRFKVVFAMLSVALVSLTTVGFAGLVNLKNNAYDNAVERLTSLANLQKKRIQNFISQNEERVKLITAIPQLKLSISKHITDPRSEHIEKINEILNTSKLGINDFNLIQVADLKGSIIASTQVENVGHKDKHAKHADKEHKVDSFEMELDFDDDNSLYGVLKHPIYITRV